MPKSSGKENGFKEHKIENFEEVESEDEFEIEDDEFEIIDIENEKADNVIQESQYFDVTEDSIYPSMSDDLRGGVAKIHLKNRKGKPTKNILMSLRIQDDYVTQL